ncbi:hypothetical protein IJG22_00725 [Candidatus Saccharibacteria bacterium]|nr:hypothetical protein [Candidatus Saccharibacteria bacterium]
MQENFIIKHSNLIILISSIGIAFCVLLTVIIALNKELHKPTYLTLQFAPSSATLTLDDGTELHTGTYELSSGHYVGTLTAKGFNAKNVDFEVIPRQSNSITNYLVNSTKGMSYYEKSAADISTLRQIKNDTTVASFLETYDHKLSLYEILPLSVSWFKRANDYPTYTLTVKQATNYPKCQSTLCIIATGPRNNQEELTKALKEKGYNINDYEVFYEYSAV